MKLLACLSASVLVGIAGAQIAVVGSNDASAVETKAATELTQYLAAMGVPSASAGKRPNLTIYVGRQAAPTSLFPEVPWDRLGPEEFVIQSKGHSLLIGGGSPRGTAYGVYRFLHRQGVRWWTPWSTSVPRRRSLQVKGLNVRESPAFEYREPYWHHTFDQDWCLHNGMNSQGSHLDEPHGGGTVYEGFVHTFYPLIPPEKYFATHPEWFSLINGKRTADNAQLCTTNQSMREELLQEVRRRLRANPPATIVSVSQNDCFNPCQCPVCQALAREQGSEAAPVLDLANFVADGIRQEFPGVAVDTLAYQYTRHAPKSLRPRPNVIVRLCSIECDFGVPLTHQRNRDFANDVRDWSRLTQRLYVWDYVTNFRHYVQPFPNVHVLGPNLQFLSQHGVKGVFEEGDYNANGGELAELKAWMIAQLLWQPDADPTKLRNEFLRGYYGRSGRAIGAYLDLMQRATVQNPAHVFDDTGMGYLDEKSMLEAEQLWRRAESSADNPEILRRVKVGHLAVQYVLLRRWTEFERQARLQHLEWPFSSKADLAKQWLASALAPGPAGWTPVTVVNEGNYPSQSFADQMMQPVPPAPVRRTPAPPKDVTAGWIDAQDSLARLWNEPAGACFVADRDASDGGAVRMPGNHHEWAFQVPLEGMPKRPFSGRWHVVVVCRVEGSSNGAQLTAGLYDARNSKILIQRQATPTDVSTDYRAFDLGAVEIPKAAYVWVAPMGDPAVRWIWVDRVYFVPER